MLDESQAIGPFVTQNTLPPTAYMSALQVLNWIAFGHAFDSDLTGRQYLTQLWCYAPPEDASKCKLLTALREMDGGPTVWSTPLEAEEYPAPPREPRWVSDVRNLAARLVEQSGLPPEALAYQRQRQIEEYAARQQELARAEHTLIHALVAERLHAFASPARDGALHPSTMQPAGGLEPVPALYFANHGVGVLAWNGAIFANHARGYVGAKFITAEVARAWPKRSIVEGKADSATVTAITEAARQPAFPAGRIRRVLEERVQSWPEGTRHPTGQEDHAFVEGFLQMKVARDPFLELRRKVVPESWLKRGRQSGS